MLGDSVQKKSKLRNQRRHDLERMRLTELFLLTSADKVSGFLEHAD